MAQGLLGAGVVAGSIAFRETLVTRAPGGPVSSLRRLGVVLKNGTFTSLILTFSLLTIAGLAFVSSSSYIFQETFGLSSQVFSFFFAVYAAGLAVGPYVYMRLSRTLARTSIITGCLGVTVLSGVLVLLLGGSGPWLFTLLLLPSASLYELPASSGHVFDAGPARRGRRVGICSHGLFEHDHGQPGHSDRLAAAVGSR